MNLSLCVTTYNRYEMTIESIEKVQGDPRITDIVILDDCSPDGSAERLSRYYQHNSKVSVGRQRKNVGMSLNKRDAIESARSKWCIIFDSDNIIGTDYLDAFEKYITDNRGVPNIEAVEKNYIFCPDFAKPDFDYRAFSQGPPTYGLYNAKDAARCMVDSRFNCLMNTCNYIVNREFYLQTYVYDSTHKASDTIWHNYNHLKAGGVFSVVPDMQYFHRVHKDSGYMKEFEYNIAKAEEVRKLIQHL